MELTPHQAKYFALELTRRTASDDMQKLVPSLMDAKVDLDPLKVHSSTICAISKFILRLLAGVFPSITTLIGPQPVLRYLNSAKEDQI